ncbi:hypothetical protein [Brachyspira sp. G79]|uniref:hypothetical protein n=1 Tax=Brachyspira sp. G79 TaxID=1358104 RepID=UPI000BBC02B2|nr:hypothetical protein [Brachyspira sp. G79]PCG20349.1 hypothetical protein KQ44_10280 [Brachyspira sp. G79]
MILDINFTDKNEKEYADIFISFLENNTLDDYSMSILYKIRNQYGITSERAYEIENIIREAFDSEENVNFSSESEEDYYNFLMSFIENGNISHKYRNIIDKKRIKNSISYSRAKELEVFAIKYHKVKDI